MEGLRKKRTFLISSLLMGPISSLADDLSENHFEQIPDIMEETFKHDCHRPTIEENFGETVQGLWRSIILCYLAINDERTIQKILENNSLKITEPLYFAAMALRRWTILEAFSARSEIKETLNKQAVDIRAITESTEAKAILVDFLAHETND